MSIIPITDIGRSVQEHGRLRAGDKKAKGGRRALSQWRLTSPDEQALDKLAFIYGGKVEPWFDQKANPRNQFQLYTEANELEVILTPSGVQQSYLLFSGKGIQRACTGVTAQVYRSSRDGMSVDAEPCICADQGELECTLNTKLEVFFPEIPFAGVWRFNTKSRNNAEQMPGMVELIQQMAMHRGMIPVRLALVEQNTPGHDFVVVHIRLNVSTNELVAGGGAYGVIDRPGQPAQMVELNSGEPVEPPWVEPEPELDDDDPLAQMEWQDKLRGQDVIEDAQIIEDAQPQDDNWFLSMREAANHARQHGGTVRKAGDGGYRVES